MNYKVNWGIAEGAFAVPDCVVDDYIKLASGKAVKVLLFLMRNKAATTENAALIAETLDKNMCCEDVEDALSYWEQVGVICRTETAVAGSSAVSKLNVEKTDTAAAVTAAVVQVQSNTISSQRDISPQRDMERATKMLSAKEIAERVNQSDEVNFLFKGTEALLGKTLTYTEQRSLIWMHDYYSMGTDILLMIIDFCKSINKPNIGYIEKIASTWNDKGIQTHEQAEGEIRQLQNYYSLAGQVVSRLGLNRSLTPKEREFVNLWAASGTSIELVEYAYEKTINSTGKVTFNYMNKILEDWNKNNLKTIPDVDSFNERYAQNKAVKSLPVQIAATDKREHSYDLKLYLEHAMNNIPKIEED